MKTFSALLDLCEGNLRVTGEFPLQRPVTRSFDVFIDLCLDKRLNKQSRSRWFEMPSLSSLRHCSGVNWYANDVIVLVIHYNDVIMDVLASQITSLTIVCLTVYSGGDQRKHQSSASLAFVTGEFPAQKASNAENVSIWWRHHVRMKWWNPNIAQSFDFRMTATASNQVRVIKRESH